MSENLSKCLEGSAILELVEQGKNSPDYAGRMEHILTCTHCRNLLKETSILEQVAQDVVGGTQVASTTMERLRSLFSIRGMGGACIGAGFATLILYFFVVLPLQHNFVRATKQIEEAQETIQQEKRNVKRDKEAMVLTRTAQVQMEKRIKRLQAERDKALEQVRLALAHSKVLPTPTPSVFVVPKPIPSVIAPTSTNANPTILAQCDKAISGLLANPESLIAVLSIGRERGSGAPQPGDFRLLDPVQERVVTTPEPLYHWERKTGATHYQLNVFRNKSLYEEYRVDKEETVAEEAKGKKPLRPGAVYFWTVDAIGPDGKVIGSSDVGKFRVLGDELLGKDPEKTLRQIESVYSKQPLKRAVLYWRFGLIADAERALTEVTEGKDLAKAMELQQLLKKALAQRDE